MTESIKIEEDDKERLDDLMDGDEITEYGELSYKDVVKYLIDEYETNGKSQTTDSDSTSSGGVTRKSAGGSSGGNSDEVEAKIDSVRLEDGGGTSSPDEKSFQGEDVESLSASGLKSRINR